MDKTLTIEGMDNIQRAVKEYNCGIEEEHTEKIVDGEVKSKLFKVELVNAKGRSLHESVAPSLQAAYIKLNAKIGHIMARKEAETKPYKVLKAEIKNLTEFELKGSSPHEGFDVTIQGEQIVIKVRKAANPVFIFYPLSESPIINMNILNVDTFRSYYKAEAHIKVLEAIKIYLSSDVDVRRKEIESYNEAI